MNTVFFKNLGLIDFEKAWKVQEGLMNSIIDTKRAGKKTKNYLLFCQHPHVYTLGKSGDSNNLLLSNKQMTDVGVDFYKTNRGGDITYHGPGQLVVYPIFDLDNFFTDIHKYLRYLEDVVINVLETYGVVGVRLKKITGVWIKDRGRENYYKKICAMGVRASRWVTMHGLAFNINVDLKYFNNIIPCGLSDMGVTSLSSELEKKLNQMEVEERMKCAFEETFGVKIVNDEEVEV